jgi:hypothetical protein
MATKEADDNNDLHSLLLSTSLLLLASPFLKQPTILPLLIVAPEMGPLFCGDVSYGEDAGGFIDLVVVVPQGIRLKTTRWLNLTTFLLENSIFDRMLFLVAPAQSPARWGTD